MLLSLSNHDTHKHCNNGVVYAFVVHDALVEFLVYMMGNSVYMMGNSVYMMGNSVYMMGNSFSSVSVHSVLF